MRQERLFGAHEIQRFNRDADETVAWIAEKDAVLSSDDYGRDLASVQTLQRKHEGVERDLAALEDKVSTLGQEADRLCGIHADHGGQIQAKRAEIVNYWESLTAKAKVSDFTLKFRLCKKALLTDLFVLGTTKQTGRVLLPSPVFGRLP